MLQQDTVVQLFSGLPAKIVKYDHATQKATVQPMIKDIGRGGYVSDLPLIQNIMVLIPSSENYAISPPIKKDDEVLLIFTCYSLDEYLESSSETPVEPLDPRVHDYNDCYAIPVNTRFPKAIGTHPTDFFISSNIGTSNEVKITLKDNGDVDIDSPGDINMKAEGDINMSSANLNIESGNVSIDCNNLTIDSPQTTMTGNLRVEGTISASTDVMLDSGVTLGMHKHIETGETTLTPIP